MVDFDTEIYRLLNKQIKINELRYLSSGDDSDTFLCNEQYVVKVPKRDSVRIAQKREFELYRFLENCNLQRTEAFSKPVHLTQRIFELYTQKVKRCSV